MSWAAMFLAAALLLGAGPGRVRSRVGGSAHRWPIPRPGPVDDPHAAASTFDLFAACLNAGMAVPTAAVAAAQSAPPELASVLRRAADLLALGASPEHAWSLAGNADMSAPQDKSSEALMRLARRSAASGSALADGIAELAAQSRHEATTSADATAERASVLIAGPLGLCYLPAFLCLGVIPVVAGLAGDVLGSGLL